MGGLINSFIYISLYIFYIYLYVAHVSSYTDILNITYMSTHNNTQI